MMKIKTRFNIETLKGLQRKETHKVVLLHSGGIDSTAAGILLKEEGYSLYPLFFDYKQSPVEVERFCVGLLAKELGFNEAKEIKVDFLKELSKSLFLGGKPFTDDEAYVPGRNTVFMVMAGIHAYEINADGVAIGYMMDDNFVFGDNMFAHHMLMEVVLSETFLRPMKVFMPTKSYTKGHLMGILNRYGVLDKTVSCWNPTLKNGKVVECGKCANCVEKYQYIHKDKE